MAEATLHIRKNDIVRVMVGKEKGKVGRVLKVDRDAGRVFVEKINMVKRHVKPGKTNPKGGIVEKEAALSYSNIMIMCDKCNKPTRISMMVEDSGERHRACKRCGDVLETKKK
ncbi:MAG TPA: 50S ribosomal protein L24 [Candidatus Deferrimicrobiaceae bacterium]|jgi:large subunit ribosomal protein L24|nr:50S ribosomal protein L24 [Candidatus Deferrimicrobiaceae bacterium]